MRILHIIPSFGIGGMEKVICSLINHTSQKYQHIILSLDGNQSASKWITVDNVERRYFRKDQDFSKYLKILYKEMVKISPDLLMTYNWGSTDAIWLGRLAGIKNIIHNEHGFSVDEAHTTRWKRDICRYVVYRMASCLVTVSSNLKNFIQERYKLSNKHIQMIPNGINTEYYSPAPHISQQKRSRLGFQVDDLVIVFSGRLDPVKNFELLLEIFEHCQKYDKHFKLLIVGDGPERE